jgi:hypothetical protein
LNAATDDGPNFVKYIIITSDSTISKVWEFIDNLMCLVSSYLYMQYATFDHTGDTLEWTIEAVFVVSMIKKLITDYKVEGND